MDQRVERLQVFLKSKGGHLHPNILIAASERSGLHWRAQDGGVDAGDTIITIPHSLTLSYLNALVDEEWPVFKKYRHLFNPDFEVEAISFFYLMIQYTNRSRSFWKPYLEALPGPEAQHIQPLFYEDPADIQLLEGSDVWHTNLDRTNRYRQMFEDGKKVLQKAGQELSWCTWDMFRWAAVTFTSRSFASRSLRPDNSKYWAAYRHGKDGRSQTVLIDMSHASASDFPVLFPGLDIGNHVNEAKIDYVFEAGQFRIKTNNATAVGEEVFNNYGPKGNDELLLGYGFCIPGNPHSTVSLTLKTPPETLQDELRNVHPGYFKHGKEGNASDWNIEQATFRVPLPGQPTQPEDIFDHLPEPLIELLIYVLRHERGYPFALIERPREYLSSSEGKRYRPHIANILMQALMAKLQKIPPLELPKNSLSSRQEAAMIYRDEQRHVIRTLLLRLQAFLRSLVVQESNGMSQRPCLVTIETLIAYCEQYGIMPSGFLDGIQANTNTRDLEQLRQAGWEQDIWVLLLVALAISGTPGLEFELAPAYVNDSNTLSPAEIAADPEHPSHSLLELVRNAASAFPDSNWASSEWTLDRLCRHARVLELDGFMVPVPSGDGDNEEARFCVYLHHAGGTDAA